MLMNGETEIKECRTCVHCNKPSCPFGVCEGEQLMSDFEIGCWQNKEDKELCDMMCGEAENDEH